MPKPSIIAIDGPVASGKTSLGRLLAQQLGYRPIDRTAVDAAIEYGRFENMQRLERTNALNTPKLRPLGTREINSRKVRKGKVGSYREELSREDIAYVDDVVFRELAPQLGYAAGPGSSTNDS